MANDNVRRERERMRQEDMTKGRKEVVMTKCEPKNTKTTQIECFCEHVEGGDVEYRMTIGR